MKNKRHFRLRKKVQVPRNEELIPIPVTLGELDFLIQMAKDLTPDEYVSQEQAKRLMPKAKSVGKKAQEAFSRCDVKPTSLIDEVIECIELTNAECNYVASLLLNIQQKAHNLPLTNEQKKDLLQTVIPFYHKLLTIVLVLEPLFK